MHRDISAFMYGHHFGRTAYPTGYRRSGRGFHPVINRWTGKPHKHAREKARNARRAK